MILKYFELNKLNLKITNFLLFHGKNEGYKNEEINKITNKFEIKVKNTTYTLISPSHRFDIRNQQDIIEEIARVHGYNNFKSNNENINQN